MTFLYTDVNSAGAEEATKVRPHASLAPVAVGDTSIDGGFWGPKLKVAREETFTHGIKKCTETDRISNFDKAAGNQEGPFVGAHYNDSDVYKMVDGASYFLAQGEYPALRREVNALIEKFAAAQQPDGYIDTYFTIDRKDQRFKHIHRPPAGKTSAKHELYCFGHLIEAGAVHADMTGEKKLLEVACKAADHLYKLFGPDGRVETPFHQEPELALIKLYRVTGEKRYLELARLMIDRRGDASTGRAIGSEFAQDHMPIRQQKDAVGHAVRVGYQWTGVADLYMETGEQALLDALHAIWKSITHRKMYLTGSVGAKPAGESFAKDYHLPNENGYGETCAAIGMLGFAHRMGLIEPDAEYADVMEQLLYGGFLSGISVDGKKFFYTNYLASKGQINRSDWFRCSCCPTNVGRIYPRVGQFAMATGPDSVFVNLYVAGETKAHMSDAGSARIETKTLYPWDGDIALTIKESTEKPWTLNLRIPGWCRNASTSGKLYRFEPINGKKELPTVSINGKQQPLSLDKLEKGYLPLKHTWKSGDVVRLHLPMPILRVRSDVRVEANRGRVALQRGPIVYCFEGIDNDRRVHDLTLPKNLRFAPRYRKGLLGGVTVLEGTALRAPQQVNTKKHKPTSRPVSVVAVPYFAWNNRGRGEMALWLPEQDNGETLGRGMIKQLKHAATANDKD